MFDVTPAHQHGVMQQATIDRHIHELSESQHGLMNRRQLRERGVPAAAVLRWIERGRLRVVTATVLRLAGVPQTSQSAVVALVLDGGPGAAASDATAADLWGLPGYAGRRLEIVAVRRSATHRRSTLGTVHQPRRIQPSHITELDGISVTTPSRVLFDLAAAKWVHPKRLERTLDTAWSRRLVSYRSLDRMLGDLGGRGRSGVVIMRSLLRERGSEYRPADSNTERRFEEIAKGCGLQGFERQVDLGDDEWIGRVDFVDRDRRVVVEVDTAMYHGSLTDRRADERRHFRLRKAGWEVLSVTDADLFYNRPALERRLHGLLRSKAS